MSIKYILFVILSIAYFPFFAQTVDCGVKGISTNPASPANPERSDALNTFDWKTQNYGFSQYLYTTGCNYVNGTLSTSTAPYYTWLSPFWDHSASEMTDRFAHDANSDFYPADGWELLYKNDGYKMDRTAANSGVVYPTYVFYQKYRGLVTVFVNLGLTDNDIKGTLLNVSFYQYNSSSNQYTSGLLNAHYDPVLCLDVPIPYNNIQIPMHYFGDGEWTTASFPVQYDPCVCHNESYMDFKFSIVKSSTFTATGRYFGVSVPQSSSSSSPVDQNYLSSVLTQGENPQVGLFTTNTLLNFQSQYIDLQQQYANYQFESAYITPMLNVFDAIFTAGATGAFSSAGTLTTTTTTTTTTGTVTTTNPITDPQKDLIRDGLSGIYDGINSSISTEMIGSAPDPPVPPYVAFGEMALAGDIADTIQQAVWEFRLPTPASFTSASCNEIKNQPGLNSINTYDAAYPIFNERLGVVTVSNTPTLARADTLIHGRKYDFPVVGITASFLHLENMDYIINPLLNVNTTKSKIYGALEIEFPSDSTTIDIPGIDSFGVYDDLYAPISADYWSSSSCIISIGYGCGDTMEYYSNPSTKAFHKESSNKIISHTMPLDILLNTNFKIYSKNNLPGIIQITPYKAYVKIIYDMAFTDIGTNGLPIQSLIEQRYPVNFDSTSFANFKTNYLVSPSPCDGLPGDLTLGDTIFIQNTTIYAWNTVTIYGNLSTAPGITVNIIAGQSIAILNGSVAPTIFLSTGNLPSPCSNNPIILLAEPDVQNFCTSTLYTANNTTMSKRNLDNSVQNSFSSSFNINLFPNPASSVCTVRFTEAAGGDVSITLTDMTGRSMGTIDHSWHGQGTSFVPFSTEGYAPGVYFVRFSDGTNASTQKLTIGAK